MPIAEIASCFVEVRTFLEVREARNSSNERKANALIHQGAGQDQAAVMMPWTLTTSPSAIKAGPCLPPGGRPYRQRLCFRMLPSSSRMRPPLDDKTCLDDKADLPVGPGTHQLQAKHAAVLCHVQPYRICAQDSFKSSQSHKQKNSGAMLVLVPV